MKRVNDVISKYEGLEENQIGFRKGYQTVDHIFTLRAIPENTFENNKGPLYLCFVDCKKAFGSVDHKLLLQKLVTYGIKGNCLKIITHIFTLKAIIENPNSKFSFAEFSRGKV